MSNYKMGTTYYDTFHQANKFVKLIESYVYDNGDFFDKNVIYINMLLSSELFLKSILLKNGITSSEIANYKHNLYFLYDKLLDDSNKNELKNRFSWFYHINIELYLKKIAKDFTDCRYMFVDGNYGVKMYFDFVQELMYEMQNLASENIYGYDTYEELK